MALTTRAETVPGPTIEAAQERIIEDITSTLHVYSMHLGHRLGLFEALALRGPLTATELAQATGTQPRYVREWLEHQAVRGVAHCENPDDAPDARRFRLLPAYAIVLGQPASADCLAAALQTAVGAGVPLDRVEEAFRSGGGVPFSAYGLHVREGQASMNKAMFLESLGQHWLPSVPGLHDRLSEGRPARIADIGCGAGWSAIAMARAYPHAVVDGYDLDEASARLARENVAARGLEDRISIHHADASDDALSGRYDLVTAFECIHDMSDPVGAMRTMRRLAGDAGTVLIMDERVADTFTPEAGLIEQMMYGWSVSHCLPASMAEQPSAATGTVLRRPLMRDMARQAGFSGTEELPIDHPFFRFYQLVA